MIAVATGLFVNGITTSAFLILARRELGSDDYATLAVMWGLLLIAGPGVFQAIEQELTRLVAHRTAEGAGARPVVIAASRAAAAALTAALTVTALWWPVDLDQRFDDRLVVAAMFALGLTGYGWSSIVRGTTAGSSRFVAYATYQSVEGLSRLVGLGLLLVAGTATVGWAALVAALGFWIGAASGAMTARPFATPGPPAVTRTLYRAIPALWVAALGEAFLLNIPPIAVDVISSDTAIAGVALNALVVARIPQFLFSAVKGSLLPALTTHVATGDIAGFRSAVLRLMLVVAAITVSSVAAFSLLGPFIVELLFDDEVTARQMALFTLANGIAMAALSLSLALIATQRGAAAATGWMAGVVIYPIAMLLPGEAITRSGMAMVIALAASSAVMLSVLAREARRHSVE